MPREVVSVHVGQCGLQMGLTFWAAALAEHAAYNQQLLDSGPSKSTPTSLLHDPASVSFPSTSFSTSSSSPASWSPVSSASDAMSTFFAPSPSPASPIRARCVLVDMEEGVLNAIARSSLAPLFDSAHCRISDVSGAGNNFAQGFLVYGPQYRDRVLEAVRRQVEDCDSLQSFFVSHSTGGGTGSGVGAAVLDALRDVYPDVYLVDHCVLPSATDDVVTSPYNAALSLEAVTQQADVVLPFDNAALAQLSDGGDDPPSAVSTGSHPRAAPPRRPQPQPTRSQSSRPKANGGSSASSTASSSSPESSDPPPSSRPIGGGFAALNSLCAAVLCSLTCGMRFPGELNVDWNDLMQNMCPYPSTNLLIPAMAPLTSSQQPQARRGAPQVHPTARPSPASSASSPVAGESPFYFHTLSMALRLQSSASAPWAAPSTVHFPSSHRDGLSASYRSQTAMEDALFASALSRRHQLLQVDPLSSSYLSCALLGRGALSLGSLQRAVAVWSPQMRFASLGDDAGGGGRSHWKLGLCSVASLSAPATVLSLANSSAIAGRLDGLRRRCLGLFQRRAHWHHYDEFGLEEDDVRQALRHLSDVAAAYRAVEAPQPSTTASASQPTQRRVGRREAVGGGRGGGGVL